LTRRRVWTGRQVQESSPGHSAAGLPPELHWRAWSRAHWAHPTRRRSAAVPESPEAAAGGHGGKSVAIHSWRYYLIVR